MESKTPTKDEPNPEPVPVPKVKAELKPIIEELRKIDSLSPPLSYLYRLFVDHGTFLLSPRSSVDDALALQ